MLSGKMAVEGRIVACGVRPPKTSAGVAVEGFAMLAFLAIFGASLAGYAGLPPWTVAAAAIALLSVSYAEHRGVFERGRSAGLSDLLDAAMLRSLLDAVIASAVAYGFGLLMRAV